MSLREFCIHCLHFCREKNQKDSLKEELIKYYEVLIFSLKNIPCN